jgi:RHS repeat-associated protein
MKQFQFTTVRPLIVLMGMVSTFAFSTSPDDANMPANLTRTTGFGYDASTGLVTSETKEPVATSSTKDPNVCLGLSYQYDSYGNKTQTTVQNCGGTVQNPFSARTASVAFNTSNHQFPVSTKNALNQTDSNNLSYDGRFGVATGGNDINGLNTTVSLDEFGRSVKVTYPNANDGHSVINQPYGCLSLSAQGYDSTDTPSDPDASTDSLGNACGLITFNHPSSGAQVTAARYIRIQRYVPGGGGTPQGPSNIVYYDVMGREIGSVVTGIDLNNTVSFYQRTLKAYDLQGRQAYTSITHTINTSGTPQTTVRWSVATFDAYGRPFRNYSPDDSGVTLNGLTNDGTSIAGLTGTVRVDELNFNTDGEVTTSRYDVAPTSNNSTTPKKVKREKKNALGWLYLSEDAYLNQMAYRYDPAGELTGTKDGAGNETKIYYDIRGNKIEQVDPDLGDWKYSYDALGQLVSQKDAMGVSQTMTYDQLGRMKSRATSEFTANYVYDTCGADIGEGAAATNWKGALCQEYTSKGSPAVNDFIRSYSFDNLGRIRHVQTKLGAVGTRIYDEYRSYDLNYVRLDTLKYPTGIVLQNAYTTRGFVKGLNRIDTGTAQALWTANGTDVYGNLQMWTLGNNLVSTEDHFVAGQLKHQGTSPIGQTETVEKMDYQYTVMGDLASRSDSITNVTDTYSHDNLHRLIQWVDQTPAMSSAYTVQYSYDGTGNLIQRSDRGTYTNGVVNSACPTGYTTAPKHGLTLISRPAFNGMAASTTAQCYDANGSLGKVIQDGVTIREHGWTSFRQPSYINWDGSGSSNRLEWLYGTGFQRVQETKLSGTVGNWTIQSKTIQLHPDHQNGLFFEQTIPTSGTIENRHYLMTPVGTIGMIVTNGDTTSSTSTQNAQIRYWHQDHLGSINALSNDSGTVLERFRYDPFGQQLDSTANLTTTSRYTNRGFTGHQELADVGLIHMNARLFDPMTGRFLSPDSQVVEPRNLQAFNRFSYCLNNVLGCTDPTGLYADMGGYSDMVGDVNDIMGGSGYGLTNNYTNDYVAQQYVANNAGANSSYGIYQNSSYATSPIDQSAGSPINYSLQTTSSNTKDGYGAIDQTSNFSQISVGQTVQATSLNMMVAANDSGSLIDGVKGLVKSTWSDVKNTDWNGVFISLSAEFPLLRAPIVLKEALTVEEGGLAVSAIKNVSTVENQAARAVDGASTGFSSFVKAEGKIQESLGIWPPNRGAYGPVKNIDLGAGEIIDRYGSTYGTFTAPVGTSFGARALPSSYETLAPYNQYQIINKIENVKQSNILPWFGQTGKGVQYELPNSVQFLLDNGFLEKVR